MPRANVQKKVGALDAGYSRVYIGIKSRIHPRRSGTSQGKIVSTSTAEKVAMKARMLAAKPQAERNARSPRVQNLTVRVSQSQN
jgi:hypothetical protein